MRGAAAVRGRRADRAAGSPAAGRCSGICVGMQVLFDGSTEPGVEATEPGLGEWPGTVERLPRRGRAAHGLDRRSSAAAGSRLFAGVERERFYFVHSYAAQQLGARARRRLRRGRALVTWAEHGDRFVAAVENGPLSRPSSTPRSPATPAPAPAQLGRARCDSGCAAIRRRAPHRLTMHRRPICRDRRPASSSCPPSTSPTAGPSSWCRAWPAPAASSATRSRPRWPGRTQGAEWLHLVDLDAAFGRGSNRELLAEHRRPARHRRRAVRRHPRRRVARGGARHRLPPGQPRHRRARGPRVDRRGHRRARRPDRRRPRRARHDAGRPRAGPGGRRPVGDPRAPRPRGLRPLRRHRRQQGRHARGPEPRPAARGVRPHRPPGRGLRRGLDPGRLRALRALVDDGVEGAIIGRRSTAARSPCPRRSTSPGRP